MAASGPVFGMSRRSRLGGEQIDPIGAEVWVGGRCIALDLVSVGGLSVTMTRGQSWSGEAEVDDAGDDDVRLVF